MTQYRVSTDKQANVREEASTKARVLFQLAPGAIVHLDPGRTPDGEWFPVVVVRGWMHKSTVKAVE